MKTSEKIYRENSYLTNIDAEVISCSKNNDVYEIILDKTIFYPHMSGGQPKDEGTINGVNVTDVREKGEEIIHTVKEPLSGTVTLSIDYDTRFDYMQQHSGQHILSYAISKLFNGKTVGFHLSKDYTTIDIDKELDEKMIMEAEMLSNKVVCENRHMICNVYSQQEAKELTLRKAPPEFENIRIVTIEGHDSVACGGTHVKYTGEVGIIKVIKTEKHKTGTRIEFLCGERAIKDYMVKNKMITDLSLLFTCRTDMLFDNILKLFEENKTIKMNSNLLNNEINDYKINELIRKAIIKNDVKFIFAAVNKDIKDLRYICSKIIECESYVVMLVCETENSSGFVIGQSKNLTFDIKDIFEKCKFVLHAKGGGNNYLLQGTGTVLKTDECLDYARTALEI